MWVHNCEELIKFKSMKSKHLGKLWFSHLLAVIWSKLLRPTVPQFPPHL